jgi:hypothetical protein
MGKVTVNIDGTSYPEKGPYTARCAEDAESALARM